MGIASPSCPAGAAGRQIWLIDAPVPRRGRPATEPKPPRPTVLTETGIDVDAFEWSPDGARIAVMARRGPRRRGDRPDRPRRRRHRRAAGGRRRAQRRCRRPLAARRFLPVRVGRRRLVPGRPAHRRWPRSDRPDRAASASTANPAAARGPRPLPSPDGSRFVHIEVHDGLQDLRRRRARRRRRRRSADAAGRRRRRGPSRPPRPATGSTRGTASGARSAGCPTAPGSRPSANARPRRRTCGCSPFPASPPTTRGRARSPIRCPAVLRAALAPGRSRRRSV